MVLHTRQEGRDRKLPSRTLNFMKSDPSQHAHTHASQN